MGYYGGLTIDFGNNYDGGGFAVSGIGDINGDGVEDFAVTEQRGSSYYYSTGAVYVVFGQEAAVGEDAGAFPLTLSVDDLDGANGFKLEADPELAGGYYGNTYGTTFGDSIAALGDVNGDGIDDFGVTQNGTSNGSYYYYGEYGYYYGGNGQAEQGVAYIIYGSTSFGGVDADSVVSVDQLEHVRIDADGEISEIIALGDVNGDGINDVGINELSYSEQIYAQNSFYYDENNDGILDADELQFTEDGRNVQVLDVTGHVIFGVDTTPDGQPDVPFGGDTPIAREGGSVDIVNVNDLDGDDGFSVDAGQTIGGVGGGEYYYGDGPALFARGGTEIGGYDNDYGNSDVGIQGAVDIDGDGFADVLVNVGGASVSDGVYIRSPGDEGYSAYDFNYGDASTFIDQRGIIAGSNATGAFAADEYADVTFNLQTFSNESETAALGNVSGNDAAEEFGVTGFARDTDFQEVDDAGLSFVEGVYVKNGAGDALDDPSFTINPTDVANGDGAFFFSGELREGFTFAAFDPQGLFGVGNMIGDAADDFVIVGNHFQPDTGFQQVAYVVAGTTDARSGAFDLEGLVGSGGAYKIFGGENTGGDFLAISAAGDVNDDGFDDIIFGTPSENSGNGEANVIFGGAAIEAIDIADGTNDNILQAVNAEVDIETGLLPIRVGLQTTFLNQFEGTGSPTDFDFTVTRTGDLSAEVSFDYAVTGGGYTSFYDDADAADFEGGVLPSGSMTFVAGSATATVNVQVAGDSQVEDFYEDFTVQLSNVTTDNAAPIIVTNDSATALIRNDDIPVTFSVSSQDATEDDAGDTSDVELTFVVTRSGETDVAATVDYQLEQNFSSSFGATAADFISGWDDDSDGTLNNGTLTFAAGITEQTVTLQVFGDEISENRESVGLRLSNALAPDSDNDAVISGTFDSGFIDDDDVPVVFSASASFLTEGDPGDDRTLTITVTRSGPTDVDASVDFSLQAYAGSNPANADDFVSGFPQSGTLTFLADGPTQQTVTAVVRGDNDVEPDEFLQFELSNAQSADAEDGVQIDTPTIFPYINNDDQPMFFSVNNASVTEGDTGDTPTMTFRVSRFGDTSEAGSVDYSIESYFSNPADAADFVAGAFPDSGTLNFTAGQTFANLTIEVQGDEAVEQSELFQVLLSNPVGGGSVTAQISDATGFGTIINDDLPVGISASSPSVTEGQDGATTDMTFTVYRTGETDVEATVDYELAQYGFNAANRAEASDFVADFPSTGTLTFAVGETQQTVTLQVVDDEVFENIEFVELRLSNLQSDAVAGNVISTPLVYGRIYDDEVPVYYRVNGASTTEGEEGDVSTMLFNVTRSGDTSAAGTIDYAVNEYRYGSSATSDDFVDPLPQTGTLSFAAGQTSATIAVAVAGDNISENTEYFEVQLSDPTSADPSAQTIISGGLAYGYIYDDDLPVYFRVSGSAVVEGDPGADNELTFTVTRFGETNVQASVEYDVAGGTANADDFEPGEFPTNGILDFAAGETSKTVTVRIAEDDDIENTEYTLLQLSNPSSSDANVDAIVSGSYAYGTIYNDDFDAQISVNSYAAVTEGDPGDARELTFTVTRSGDTASTVNMDYAFTPDSLNPLSSADFEGGLPQSGSLTFNPGETSKTVSFAIAEDEDIELNERGVFTISNAEIPGTTVAGDGVTVVRSSAIGVVNNDDYAPRILTYVNGSLYGTSINEGNSGFTNVDVRFLRDGSTDGPLTLTYDLETTAGSVFAANSQDIDGFLPSFGNTVEFADGESEQIVTIRINGDGLIEANESFSVNITDVDSNGGPTYDVFNPTSFITIRNDDGRPPLPELWVDFNENGIVDDGEIVRVEADVFGDPHIVTLDGLGYDFQAVGEYVLVETEDGATNPFSVQVRFEAFPGSDLVSVTTRMAVEVKGATVELDALGDTPLLIDGAAPDADALALGAIDLDDDGTADIYVDGDKYFIVLNEANEQLMVGVMDGSLNVCVFLADPVAGGNAGNVRGLMGNANGDLSDDFALRDGSEIPESVLTFDAEDTPSLTFDYIYGRGEYEGGGYRASWALADGESLFSGDLPVFPDNFPAAPLSVDNLPDDVREAAEQAARDAGVDEGNAVIFENAVLDFALTGDGAFLGGATQLAATPEAASDATEAPEIPQTVNVAAGVASVVEGDTGVQAVSFTFFRIGDATGALTVDYAIAGDVDAADLADGTPLTGTVAFDEGEVNTTLEVLVKGDLMTEGDEGLIVQITGTDVEGVLIGGAQGETTIATDDFGPDAKDDQFSLSSSENVNGNLIDDNDNDDTIDSTDSDADGDTLTVTRVFVNGGEAAADGSPIDLDGGGRLTVSDNGDVSFDPDGDFDGLGAGEIATVSFDYEVSDGNGGTDTATASFTIQGEGSVVVNEAPIAADDDVTVNEDVSTAIDFLSNDEDPEGDDLTVTIVDGPANGELTFDGEEWRYKSDPNYNGDDSFTYTVSDGELSSELATVSITVDPVNDDPDAIDDEFSTAENGIFIGSLLDNDEDIDNDSLTITTANGVAVVAAGIDIDVTSSGGREGTVSVLPEGTFDFAFNPGTAFDDLALGESDTVTISYAVSDGKGGTDTASATVTVNGANDLAEFTSPAEFTVDEGTSAVGTIAADDVDGDDVTFSIAGGADAVLFDINATTGELSFKAAPDFEGPTDANGDNDYAVEVGAFDGTDSVTQAVTVTVANVNEAPEITSAGSFDMAENETAVGTVFADDTDGDELSFSVIGGADAALFDIDATSGALSFKTAPDFEAPGDVGEDNTYEVEVQVSDGDLVDDQFVFVNVTDVDENPVVTEVLGTAGRDNLVGTDGADVIVSGGGSYDRMTGGDGPDTFVFGDELDNDARERDVITDFDATEDMLLLANDNYSIRDIRGGVYIRHDDDFDTIYVLGDDVNSDNITIEIGTYDPFVL